MSVGIYWICGTTTAFQKYQQQQNGLNNLKRNKIMKQETREYDLLQHIKFCLECKNESQAIRLIEKYGFQKQQEMYSEEDLESAWNSSEQNMRFKFSSSAYKNVSFKKWLENFKKK